MRPEVTWILPVRNGMPFLPATLASAARQTYGSQRMIAWDNGSTDGSVEELRRWIPSRIPGMVVADRPGALGDSTRGMVEMAATELIAHTDQDDVSLPHRLETQVRFLGKHPKVGFLGSRVEYIDERDLTLTGGWQPPEDDASLRWMVRWGSPFVHSSMMFRRSAAIAAGNFRATPGIAWDDLDMWMRGSFVAEFRNLRDPLIQLRRHPSQTTASIRDYKAVARIFAGANSKILFPGVSEARTMELWEILHPEDQSRNVKLWHIITLRRAAAALARRLSKSADYFTSSQYFRDQMYWLRRRFAARMGLPVSVPVAPSADPQNR